MPSSPVEGTLRTPPARPVINVHLPSNDNLANNDAAEREKDDYFGSHVTSPSDTREAAHRLNDDLELLRAERVVSRQEHESRRSHSRNRSQESNGQDTFNMAIPAAQGSAAEAKTTWLTRIWARLRKFPRVLRYVVYAIPPGILILIPVFLDLFNGEQSDPVGGNGGVKLLWFGIWVEVVWLTLWAARIVTSIMPSVVSFVARAVGSGSAKKWKDVGRHLELSMALFLWLLAILISYYPILNGHRVFNSDDPDAPVPDIKWITVLYKVVIALFVLTTLNFAEKILIQWIAASFHRRTYSLRIRENQIHIGYLVALYEYAKTRCTDQDLVWDPSQNADSSGSRTPMRAIQNNARQAWSKVGDAATRVAGDFTGKRVLKPNHPRKVVVELLRNTQAAYTLARVFYRTFSKPDRETMTVDDFLPAFQSQEDAEACFNFFDRDLNGDISMEELEMVCNEIHLEKKAIAASLKDLDSVIKKLDSVFMFIILVIVVIVFISILSNSAAAGLTSTGTVILGLSWLLQATAQEFLQVRSIITHCAPPLASNLS